MNRTCLKCGQNNAAATGDELEACPACGAIYSRVEAAFSARSAGVDRPQVSRAPTSSGFGSRNGRRADDEDIHAFAETLRADSLYPTFRSLVKLIYWFLIVLAALSAIGSLMALFTGNGVGRIGGFIGGVFVSLFFVLIARLTSETSLMLADLSDAAVRIAAKS